MNIDDLKRDLVSTEVGNERAEAIGWNAAIDYLASRGYLATQQPADAIETAPKDKAVPEWQPIETAPKMYDKWCIVGHPDYTVCEIAYFNKRHNCWRTSGMSVFIPNGPTHWMPLPQPPKSDSPTFGLNPSGIVVRLFK